MVGRKGGGGGEMMGFPMCSSNAQLTVELQHIFCVPALLCNSSDVPNEHRDFSLSLIDPLPLLVFDHLHGKSEPAYRRVVSRVDRSFNEE